MYANFSFSERTKSPQRTKTVYTEVDHVYPTSDTHVPSIKPQDYTWNERESKSEYDESSWHRHINRPIPGNNKHSETCNPPSYISPLGTKSSHLSGHLSSENTFHREQNHDFLSHNFASLKVGTKFTTKSADNSTHFKLTPTAKVAPLMEARKTTKPISLQSQDEIDSDSRGHGNERLKQTPKQKTILSQVAPQSYDVYSGDVLGTVDKWKVLIETKDRILSQKDDLIKRYVHVCLCIIYIHVVQHSMQIKKLLFFVM